MQANDKIFNMFTVHEKSHTKNISYAEAAAATLVEFLTKRFSSFALSSPLV